MRTGMILVSTCLLALGSLSLPARADEAADRAAKLDQMQRALAAIQRDLTEMRTTEQVRGSATAAHTSQINALEERIARLERDVADLVSARGQTTTSGYFNPANPAGQLPLVPRRGVIHLSNRFDMPAVVILNGQSYSLAPYQSLDVRDVPAGVFRYQIEVDGFGLIQPETARALAPAGSHNITIYPRATAATSNGAIP